MAYSTVDKSIDDGAPIFMYRISSTSFATVYRLTNAETNQLGPSGLTYLTTQGIRCTPFDVVSILSSELTVDVYLPADHPVAQKCCFQLLPQDVYVTIYRKHRQDSEIKVEWVGAMIGSGAGGAEAFMRTGSIIQNKLNGNLRLPVMQRRCNNEFCDPLCGLNIADFTETVTVAGFEDKYVEISSSGFAFGQLVRGKAKNMRTGETHPIFWHQEGIVGAEMIGIAYPYCDIQVGDTFQVTRGCNYLRLGDCLSFDNIDHYNGMDLAPVGDIFATLNTNTVTTTSSTTTTNTTGEAAETPEDPGFPWTGGGISGFVE